MPKRRGSFSPFQIFVTQSNAKPVKEEVNMNSATKPKSLGKRALKANIEKGFSDNIGRLAKMISKGKRNEDETRRWIIDILKQCLGYTDDEIETECRALGQRVDIALLENEEVFAVIECKSANIAIKQTAIDQATNYATSLGVEWAIVTNGQSWSLYHVEQQKSGIPEIIEVFFVELLDEDGVSKDDINSLYLLTKKSFLSGETETAFHLSRISEPSYIWDTVLSDNVVKAIIREVIKKYKKDYGIELEGIKEDYIKELLEIYIEPLITE